MKFKLFTKTIACIKFLSNVENNKYNNIYESIVEKITAFWHINESQSQ